MCHVLSTTNSDTNEIITYRLNGKAGSWDIVSVTIQVARSSGFLLI